MKHFCSITTILFLVFCTAFAAAGPIHVSLKPKAMVKAEGMVKLSDIASVQGTAAQKKNIGQVGVLVAPKPGCSKTVDADYIQRKLESVRIKNVKVDGAAEVTVEGECVRIETSEIIDRAKAYLEGLLPVLSKGTYSISVAREPEELVLPVGDKLDLAPRLMFSEPKIGSNYVLLDAKVDGKTIETARVNLKVVVMVEALTASATIRKGEVISAQNTSLTQVEAANRKEYLGSDILSGNDPVVSNRTLMPGTALCVGDVTNQVAVKKGDVVTLVVRCGNVKLATTAEAKQDGCKGESVIVRSDISTTDVQARVIEPGLVEIKR